MARLTVAHMARLVPYAFTWRRREIALLPTRCRVTVSHMVRAAPDLFTHAWQRLPGAANGPSFDERHHAALAAKTSSLPKFATTL